MTVCTGIRRDGEPCTATAQPDTDPPRCRHHTDQPDDPAEAANWTPERWGRFLDAYRQTGIVTSAAQTAGMSTSAVYDWVVGHPAAREQMAQAREEAYDTLERVALQRATVGNREPVYYQGEVVGHVNKPSDTLLIFLLKAARPERFRENRRVTHAVEGRDAAEQIPMHLQEQAEALRQAGYDVQPSGRAGGPVGRDVLVVGGSRDEYLSTLRELRAGAIDVDEVDDPDDD